MALTNEELLTIGDVDPNSLSGWAALVRRGLSPSIAAAYGKVPRTEYADALRGAVSRGLAGIPLAATMGNEAARIGALRGLDPALADAINAAPALQTIREAYAIADALEQTRTDIAVGESSALNAIPESPSLFESTASGAIQGGIVGGPLGAVAGGTAGLLSGLGGQDSESQYKKNVKKRSKAAYSALSPQEVTKTLAEQSSMAREEALAGGLGGLAAQNLQAAISRSGLRDSALGTLGGVAAAALPEQLARTTALSKGLSQVRRNVEVALQRRVRQPEPDRLTEALGTATEGFLMLSTLFPGQQGGSGSLLPGGEDLFKTPRPSFQIPNSDQYLPR